MTLDINSETFMMQMAIWEQKRKSVHFKRQAQIEAQMKVLIFNKAPIEDLTKYFNYNNIFLREYIAELPENTRINEYIIKLEEGKQSSFGPIYSLGLIELKTVKIYIKTNLANGFIQPSKSSVGASILFNKKLDRSLRFCMDYQSFNNLTIKNRYPLPLIDEVLD